MDKELLRVSQKVSQFIQLAVSVCWVEISFERQERIWANHNFMFEDVELVPDFMEFMEYEIILKDLNTYSPF